MTLSAKSKALFDFYDDILAKTPAQKELLTKALQSLDISDQAQEILEAEGLTITSAASGVARAHPCLSTRKEALAEVVKVFKILGLDKNQRDGEYGLPQDIV